MIKDDYFKLPGYSNSELKNFAQSPEYYKYRKNNPTKPTPAMLIGSCLHYLVFEPDNFDKYMKVLDTSKRPSPSQTFAETKNKAWKAKFYKEAEGLEVIEKEDYDTVQRMRDKLYATPESALLLNYTRNEYEKVLQWEADGIQYKGKLDIYSDQFICDLKKAACADVAYFRAVINSEYFQQGGMYADGDRILSDSSFMKPFYFIAVEDEPPYGVSVHLLTDDYLEYGATKYRTLGQQLKVCEQKNYWPSYPFKSKDGIELVDLPKYLRE